MLLTVATQVTAEELHLWFHCVIYLLVSGSQCFFFHCSVVLKKTFGFWLVATKWRELTPSLSPWQYQGDAWWLVSITDFAFFRLHLTVLLNV